MSRDLSITADGVLKSNQRTAFYSRNGSPRVRVDGRPVTEAAPKLTSVATPYHDAVFSLDRMYSDNRAHLISVRKKFGIGHRTLVWESRNPLYADDEVFTLTELQNTQTLARAGGYAIKFGNKAQIIFDDNSLDDPIRIDENHLSGNDDFIGSAQEHRSYRPWAAFVMKISNAYIDPAYGGVYLPDGRIWQGSKYLANSTAETVCRVAIAGHHKIATAPAKSCMIFCNSVRNTYFHWHLDCLSGLVMARGLLGENFLPIGPPMNAWQRESLKLLGESPVEWTGLCRPETAVVPAHIDGRGIYPDRWVCAMFDKIRSNARVPSNTGRGAKLFISREDAGHRRLENEAELSSQLRRRGFSHFVPGRATYEEQIAAFASAEVVVASHGSALTNIGFCRPGATIVEILPGDYINGCFRFLAIARQLRHCWYVSPHVEPFRVDILDFLDHCEKWGVFS